MNAAGLTDPIWDSRNSDEPQIVPPPSSNLDMLPVDGMAGLATPVPPRPNPGPTWGILAVLAVAFLFIWVFRPRNSGLRLARHGPR